MATEGSQDQDALRLDSDTFAQGPFRPHGRSEVWTEGQIIHVDTHGPFNVEAVAAINRTRSRLLGDKPPQGNYAYINTFHISAMMTADALAEYEAGLRDAYLGRYTPPVAMAWVFQEPIEGGTLMRPLYEKVFAAVGIPFRIFEDVEPARIWVGELLAAAGR